MSFLGGYADERQSEKEVVEAQIDSLERVAFEYATNLKQDTNSIYYANSGHQVDGDGNHIFDVEYTGTSGKGLYRTMTIGVSPITHTAYEIVPD